MPEKQIPIIDEILALFFKVLLPALIGVSIKIAIEMERKKMTIKRAIISVIAGVGLAWLSSGVIIRVIGIDYQPLMIAVVAITAEKVMEYMLYKFNIDMFLGALLDAGKNFIINLITGKKE